MLRILLLILAQKGYDFLLYFYIFFAIFLYFKPSIYLSVYTSIYLYIYTSIHLSIHQYIYLYINIYIYLPIYLSTYLSIYLSSIYLPGARSGQHERRLLNDLLSNYNKGRRQLKKYFLTEIYAKMGRGGWRNHTLRDLRIKTENMTLFRFFSVSFESVRLNMFNNSMGKRAGGGV